LVTFRSNKGRDTRRPAIAGIVRRLHRLLTWVDSFSRTSRRKFGLTGPETWALRTIASVGSITQKDLIDRVQLHATTVKRITRRLESGGFIASTPSSLDGQSVLLLAVRPRGYVAIDRLPEPPRSLIAKRLESMTDHELDRIRLALDQLTKVARTPGTER
jgi:DNA-binding MarR family transcriptional regulator